MTNQGRGKPRRWILVLALATIPVPLFAQSINLTFQSVAGGVSIIGAGTNIAILNLGTVSAFEPLGSGVSRTTAASDYTISTQFGVRVVRVLGTSSNYTLQARLPLAHPLTWRVDGVAMTTNSATVATLQPYASTLSHTLDVTVPFSYIAGVIESGFEVMAIAN